MILELLQTYVIKLDNEGRPTTPLFDLMGLSARAIALIKDKSSLEKTVDELDSKQ
jgi:hypothetical protein